MAGALQKGSVKSVLMSLNLNVANIDGMQKSTKVQLLTVSEDFSTSGSFNVGTLD